MPAQYFARLAALATDAAATPADQLPRLRKLLEAVLRDEFKRRGASFGNLSQAIGFVVFEHELNTQLRQQLQELRLKANLVLHESYPGTAAEVVAGFEAVTELIEQLTGVLYDGPTPPPLTKAELHPADYEAARLAELPAAPPTAWRVHVLATNLATAELTVELVQPADGRPAGPFDVVLPDAYASLLPLAATLHPVLHLIGPVALPDGRYQPRRVVLEPDYLVSVTTVAECAQKDGTIPEWALISAFLPDESSRPLVLGNLVNMLLDEEVSFAARQEELRAKNEDLRNQERSAALATILAGFRTRRQGGLENAGETGFDDAAPPAGASLLEAGVEGKEFDLEHFLHKRLFRLAPLPLSTLPEFQTRNGVPELLNDLRRHHRTLRDTQRRGFVADSRSGYQQQRLRVADCFLEPTFLSATYGLQGRLDLLHESATGYDLIELKSSKAVPGGPPWTNHTAQAQLYRLLLESVFGADGETAGRGRTSILYSNATEGQAAVRRVDQDQNLIDRLLNARNQLVGVELQLARATGPRQTRQLLTPVIRPDLAGLPSFGREKAQGVANAWAAADLVERAYCLELIRFSAREMRLTLLGDEARPGDAGGQAGLWLLPQARKHQNFSLLDELVLLEDHSNADDDARDGLGPHLIFQRPAGGREVNFRAGDTLILYPRRKADGGVLGASGLRDLEGGSLGSESLGGLDIAGDEFSENKTSDSNPTPNTQHPIPNTQHPTPPQAPKPPSLQDLKPLSPLDSQVVKVVLAEDISAEGHVVLAVRNRRLAPRYLNGHSHWALEPDTYDTFRREWASLSAFLGLAPERRQRLLGRSAPRRPAPECWTPASPPATTAPEVVARALAAPDWFVLCGPPGTGKTRAVLRELAERLYKEDKHTLLAAYTNRAVDEICEQLVAAGLPFIRVGSRLGTAPHYRPYLLDNMLRDCATRQAVRDRLKNCPFYVGTVASLLGKPELFTLKQFDLAVVDEASQVLEAPMLALLSKVNKFILIGDHRQLPAVVAQEPEASAVAEEVADLLRDELGLTNMRNSYFERLFRRAEARWPYAHGTLADHYRMHTELVALVNDDFYAGQLRCPLPWQREPLNRAAWPAPTDELTRQLHGQRLIFRPTRRQPEDLSMKESAQEADLAARAAAYVVQGYGPAFNPETTLGIIASYRNQAALIRARLAALAAELALPQLTQVSVDTVERYQGSQREVIIVSFCCHHEHQLELMVSPNEDGTVDRKLNVALTRARQQLVLLGNELMLSRAPHHAALLARVFAQQ